MVLWHNLPISEFIFYFQRFMTWPLMVATRYLMFGIKRSRTNGGVSMASKMIHVAEDSSNRSGWEGFV